MVLSKRAQSTLEYVIVLTAIIAVVIAFAAGVLRSNVKTSLEHVGNQMQDQVNRVSFNGS